ncbi:MAG: hypothetical protein QM708_06205 [Propioniciclava sp.]|uniref:hypothetical protein n=1 Tax=Propioniciclava sp. TaxID=2038686 RepID=UPI0039E3B4D4
MTGAGGVLEAALGGRSVVVEVPAAGVEDWVAVAEVLLQEGLSAWALPPSLIDCLPEVLALFGRRARIGVTGLVDAAGVRRAAEVGAQFLLAAVGDPSLAEAAGEVPLIPGALTPTEIAALARAGAGTVLVTPSDALGMSYARTLPPLFPETGLVVAGRLEHYQCSMWLDAGAKAVVVSDAILRQAGDEREGSLDEIARRAEAFRGLVSGVR